MRLHHGLALAFVAVWCAGASAQDTGAGAGLMLGNTLGMSAKLWHTPALALAGGLGASLEGDRSLIAHVDYLFGNAPVDAFLEVGRTVQRR